MPPQSPPRRALVVDDNPVNREVALHLLGQFGCETEAAADGATAVAAHRARGFDLILMDCEMPGMDGYEATRQLRAAETGGRAIVLALTVNHGAGQEARCREAGMDGLLAKPLRLPALHRALADCHAPVAGESVPAPCDEIDAVRAVFGPDFPALATLYLRDGPPRMAALQSARLHGESALLARTAHVLGGSSASIGATGLADMCRRLEARSAAGSLEHVAPLLHEVDAEFRRVARKLQALLDEPPR